MRTERVEVRRVRRGDADALRAVYDAQVLAAQGWTPEQVAQVDRWVDRRRFLPYQWVVVDRSTGIVVGDISVRMDGGMHYLGLSLGPDGRRRGFGFDAVGLVVDRMLKHTGGWIVIDTAEDNVAMQRIAEQHRFTRLGSFLETLPNGTEEVSVRYSLPIGKTARRERREAAANGAPASDPSDPTP
jgi:RimJ/RimL family protein N-acetyltransferase